MSVALNRPAVAHIDPWGFRNRDVPVQKPENEIWIGLFGGSVAFSVASTSDETTIAKYLEASLAARAPVRKRIRVLNFALPAGQQPQQFVIYSMKAAMLNGVITFDGINEVVVPAYYNRNAIPPDFPYRPLYEAFFARGITDEQRALQWLVEEEERQLEEASGLRRFVTKANRQRRIANLNARLRATALPAEGEMRSIFPTPATADRKALIDAGADNWGRCSRAMYSLAKAAGADMLSILQPVPERHKRLTPSERRQLEQQPDVVEIRSLGYEALCRRREALVHDGVTCVDFANVFVDHDEELYVDLIHFNDEGCRVVAEKIADHVVASWNCVLAA